MEALVALIAAIPASIAAWAALKSAKRVKTSNGNTIAQLVEAQTEWQKLHALQDAHNFGVLADRFGIDRRELVLDD